MKSRRIYYRVLGIYPKRYVRWLKKNLAYVDAKVGVEKLLFFSFFYGLAFATLAGVFSFILFSQPLLSLFVAVLVFLLLHITRDASFMLVAEKRGKWVEEVLPDALQLMASNIRSGLTPDKALLFAARPEFGVFQKELKFAANRAMAGESLEDALLKMTRRIKSKLVEKTFTLIVEGMRKGGEMARLLEQTAEDIRNLKVLRKEIASQVAMYAIFIFLSVGFAAPILFGFSSYLVETMSKVGASIKVEEASAYAGFGSLRFGSVRVSPEFIRFYSLASLTITSIFGGLIVGLLQRGTEKAGIKYVPILLLLTWSIFFLTRIFIVNFLGIFTPTATLP